MGSVDVDVKPETEPKDTNRAEEKLLESALHLFADKGYEGTSIREIIERAGVTRPVLYYYFENKQDLFKRLVEMKFAAYTAELEENLDTCSDTIGRLKGLSRTTFALAEESPETVRLILQVFFSPPQSGPPLGSSSLAPQRFRIVEEVMREGLAKGDLAGGDAKSLALIFLGIMDMHVMAKSDRPDTHLTSELAEGLVDLFFFGACYKDSPPTRLVSPYTYV